MAVAFVCCLHTSYREMPVAALNDLMWKLQVAGDTPASRIRTTNSVQLVLVTSAPTRAVYSLHAARKLVMVSPAELQTYFLWRMNCSKRFWKFMNREP